MVRIDGESLSIQDVVRVSRYDEPVGLSDTAVPRIERSRDFVHEIVRENRVVYGITTGVGDLSNSLIPPEEAEQLQINLIRSHAVNVDEPFPEDVVRAVILLRANALAKGFSGVRVRLIQALLDLLNKGVCPYIPSKGSVGASGDLSPLAHLALVVIGEGECMENENRVPSRDVLEKKGIAPVRLKPKEGLALINGTQVMAAIGCLVVEEAGLLMKNAQIAGAMSLEALQGTSRAFDEKVHRVRPHAGQIRCAKTMRRLVRDSAIIASHANCEKVQDAYTLRCIPQVYGAIMDTLDYVKGVLEVEINAATDNPLIFPEEGEVISGGNFHGEPLAFAMDYLGIALSEIGNISERTLDRLVNPHVSGLPPFLVKKSGINSGFMITQYTAAALVSENKVFAHPASVDSIPTSAGQEDHVSMGTISARHAWEILKNTENVLAIEMLAAAQGIDFHDLEPGVGTKAAHAKIRDRVSHVDDDRVLYQDVEAIRELMIQGELVNVVEDVLGPI